MVNTQKPLDRVGLTIRKVARVWSLVIIGLALLLFIFEAIEALSGVPGMDESIPLAEYMIPVTLFLSIVGLVIAWRWESLGGGMAIALALACLGLYWGLHGRGRGLIVVAVILIPIIIPGVMFLTCGLRSRNSIEAVGV